MEMENSHFGVQDPLLTENEDLEPFTERKSYEVQMDSRHKDLEPFTFLTSYEVQMDSRHEDLEPVIVRESYEVQMDSRCDDLPPVDFRDKCIPQTDDLFISNFFEEIAEGNLNKVTCYLEEIKRRYPKLKYSTVKVNDTGQTCLMKALMNLNENTDSIVRKLLAYAEDTEDLKELLDAAYTHEVYEGQTALHIAIERKQVKMVELLVSKGANVSAKAQGVFFQISKTRNDWFYFGEYPLSLAACTNQPYLVGFLLENEYGNCADIAAQDKLGNTVLHALVTISDDSKKKRFVMKMYDEILKKSEKQRIKTQERKRQNLEKIRNNEELTPLQLAAKSGKLKILTHILSRQYKDEDDLDVSHLSRKFEEWAYGPVCCSLYDLSEVDTREKNSVLATVVYNTRHKNHYEMLNVEPLKELIDMKWDKFAAVMFYISAVLYLSYMITYSLITSHQPLVNQTYKPDSEWKDPGVLAGQVYTFMFALYLLISNGAEIFLMYPYKLSSFLQNGYFHVLFLSQALLVLCTNILHWAHGEEHTSVLVAFAVVLGWFNVLYYAQGLKITGIYTVMLQRMILRDVLRFLFVYVVFLVGFARALASLMEECPQDESCSPFAAFPTAVLELFKLTLGLGDLSVHEQSRHPFVFLLLLVIYVILTFVLLLNMLIALMGETVNNISEESERIWRLQRAMTILDLEKRLPEYLRIHFQKEKIDSNVNMGYTPLGEADRRTCIRVNDVNWKYWSECKRNNEDPGKVNKKKGSNGDADDKDKSDRTML
ncbi:transient receptor potential cation channel subfamily V member 3-like isoform X2 [Rhinatrema bivittatum]|nr:transient receptor potential cation channel subfamily V member 3-like isoform X2 [Rhinatrema bivittatum]